MKQEAAPVAMLCERCGKMKPMAYAGLQEPDFCKCAPPKVERGEELRAVRHALACAIIWACTEQGGYTKLDEKYYRWAKAVIDELPDAVAKDILDAGIAALDASPPVEQVPREPTYEMVQAGALVVKNKFPHHTGTREIWIAMYDAAPVEGRNKGES